MTEFGRSIDHSRIEKAVEIAAVRARLIDFVKTSGGGKDRLLQLLEAIPQRGQKGSLLYLVTSGMAVELITGVERPHHDLDLVIMDQSVTYWNIVGTDNVTPGEYWADMKFEPRFLEATAQQVGGLPGGMMVEVVHPAIILVQKCSNAFCRPPRDKDIFDVQNLIRFARQNRVVGQWMRFINHSFNALPQRQQSQTRQRLKDLISKTH